MTAPNDGGHAYPTSLYGHPGMSLRDWFAGQALAGLGTITTVDPKTGETVTAGPESAARIAYTFADAMLAERGKR